MPLARVLALIGGFIAGIIAQVLFQRLINQIIGPVPGVLTGKMLGWLAILLIPPLASYMFLTINPGTVQEDFIQGLQAGAVFAFVVILIRAFT